MRNSKSKLPASLSQYHKSNRVELFNFWLDSGKDWNQTALRVERHLEGKNSSKRGWEAVQGKELRKRFTDEEKFKKLISSRKQSGMFYTDDDFPDDDDETQLDIRVQFSKICFFTKLREPHGVSCT